MCLLSYATPGLSRTHVLSASIVLAMVSSSTVAAGPQTPSPALSFGMAHDPTCTSLDPKVLPPDFNFMPAVGISLTALNAVPAVSMQTKEGALKWMSCLKESNPSFSFMVVEGNHDQNLMAPFPWIVSIGAYQTLPEATQTLRFGRCRIRVDKTACAELLTENINLGGNGASGMMIRRITVLPPTNQPGAGPGQISPFMVARTPMAAFDGIGRSAYSPKADSAIAVVHASPATSPGDVLQMMNHYQSLNPDVHFAAIRHGHLYYLTVAAFTSKAVLKQALYEVRRRGLYEFGLSERFPPNVSSSSTQLAVKTKLMILPLRPTPLKWDTNVSSDPPQLLERSDLFASRGDRVKRCYADLAIRNANEAKSSGATEPERNNPRKPRADEVAECSGVAVSDIGMTKCLFESDCKSPIIPPRFRSPPVSLAGQCVKTYMRLSIALAPTGKCTQAVANLDDGADKTAQLQQCVADMRQDLSHACAPTTMDESFLATLASVAQLPADCMKDDNSPCNPSIPSLNPVDLYNNYCVGKSGDPVCSDPRGQAVVVSYMKRIVDVSQCLNGQRCDGVVPRLGYDETRFRQDIANIGARLDDPTQFTKDGLAFLTKSQADMVNDFTACKNILDRKGTSNGEAQTCFHKLGLTPAEQKAYDCLAGANGDSAKIATCAIPNLNVANQVAKLKCFQDAGTNLERLTACGGVDTTTVQAAKEAINCVSGSADPVDAATKCVLPLPAPVLNAMKCASTATKDMTVAQISACLPDGLGDKVATANCIAQSQAQGASPTDSFKCLPNFVAVLDPKLQAAVACAARFADATDNQQKAQSIQGCLPPDVANAAVVAACVADKDTDASRMACLAPSIGVDPRTASLVSCLAQANGENIAMASCAASTVLPPEVAKAMACAAQSSGAADFALCESGFGLNPEARIAAECAVESGGTPPAFAACTAGRLTVRELTKCLSGKIGSEDGCFGPNNTLVQAERNYIHDILHGPGASNDIVKALGQFTNPLQDSLSGLASSAGSLLQSAGDGVKNFFNHTFGFHL